jgi:hypothetical protein
MMLSKEYFKTARILLRVAEDMAERAIAERLKALAEDYELRAEKASRIDVTKAPARAAKSRKTARNNASIEIRGAYIGGTRRA